MTDYIRQLTGIVTVLNTPFDEANRVDLDALARHTEVAMNAGVSGFLLPAMAGEVDKLTLEERLSMVERVVETVGGSVPVIGGASAATGKMRTENIHRLADIGVAGILVAISYESEEGYIREVESVASEIDRGTTSDPPFLMIQDFDPRGYGAPVDLIVRLFEDIPSFRSIKIEVVPAGRKYSEVIEATKGHLHVAGGWAVSQMVEALDRGVDTLMPTGMHEGASKRSSP